jgi:hypothetical protein
MGQCRLLLDQFGCVPKILCDQSGADVRAFFNLAEFTFPLSNENRSAPSPGARQQIRNAISYDVALGERHLKFCRGFFKQAGPGLTALAATPQRGHYGVRVV